LRKQIFIIFLLLVAAVMMNAHDIFQSAENGDIEAVRNILERYPNIINMRNNDGNTPLHIAVLKGYEEIFEYIVSHNPDLEIKNNRGFTPLLCAAWMFHRDSTKNYKGIIKSLLVNGAKADVTGKGRYNPLHWINHPSDNALQDIVDLNTLFINKGINLNDQNLYGSTPLHYAVHIHPRVAKILIDNRADVNVKDKQGRTPLFRISGFDHPEAANTVKLLINNGAIINTQDNNGQTAVKRALVNGRKDIADMLISYQNNIDIREFPVLKGPYLGQKPPGITPEIFAPGIISTEDFAEFKGSFSPNGKEYYFYKHALPAYIPTLFFTWIENGMWTKPIELQIALGARAAHPCISHDNKRLFFAWTFRKDPTKQSGFYVSERADTGWSAPQYAGKGMYLTSDNSGQLYTTESLWGNQPKHYLSKVTFRDGIFSLYEKQTIHPHYENQLHPCIAPDGSYIIFDVNIENSSLYVSFKDHAGKWREAIDLSQHGFKPNTRGAYISPDGKYLFFSYKRDIWWVNIQVIENLRPVK
jgi:ankyrin repeat protein